MKWNKKGSLVYLTFESFEKTGLVNHCFTTRKGGVSSGYFESLNLSRNRNDSEANVLQNYNIICSAIGSSSNDVVMSKKQIHSVTIHCATLSDRGKGINTHTDIIDTDGFVTNIPNVLLTTFHADCTPLFFLDTAKKVIGLSHAGWRGTVNGMALKTIEKMRLVYGSEPKDIIAGIGPAIGKCCFQVDAPVVSEFQNKLCFANEFIEADISEKGKFKIDLPGINKRLMLEAGILEEAISVANICTKCNTDNFYSHRAMGEQRGNMAAMLGLRP